MPINDDLQMYNKLNCILKDDSLYDQLAKDALRLVPTLTVENMCIQTEEIYNRKQEFLNFNRKWNSFEGTLNDY